MGNFTTVEVQDLKPGDKILNKYLELVEVSTIGKSYLGPRSLYQLNENGPIFTSEHQFFVDHEVFAAVSPPAFLQSHPQLEEILDERQLQPIAKVSQLLAFSNSTIMFKDIQLKEYTKMPPDTLVYFIIAGSKEQDNSYIVDNFVSRDPVPDFDLWPMTYATIGAVGMSPLLNLDSNMTYDDFNKQIDLAEAITNLWEQAISHHDWDMPVQDSWKYFEPNALWKQNDQILQSIDEKGLFNFVEHLDIYASKMLHETMDNDKIPLAKRVGLMLKLAQIALDEATKLIV